MMSRRILGAALPLLLVMLLTFLRMAPALAADAVLHVGCGFLRISWSIVPRYSG
jgi:hypothetical protein